MTSNRKGFHVKRQDAKDCNDDAKGGRKANMERDRKEADLKAGGRKANFKEGHRKTR